MASSVRLHMSPSYMKAIDFSSVFGKLMAEVYENAVLAFADSPADSQVLQGFQFFKVFDEHQLEYVLLAKGDNEAQISILVIVFNPSMVLCKI